MARLAYPDPSDAAEVMRRFPAPLRHVLLPLCVASSRLMINRVTSRPSTLTVRPRWKASSTPTMA
jgi:hypothetical protein